MGGSCRRSPEPTVRAENSASTRGGECGASKAFGNSGNGGLISGFVPTEPRANCLAGATDRPGEQTQSWSTGQKRSYGPTNTGGPTKTTRRTTTSQRTGGATADAPTTKTGERRRGLPQQRPVLRADTGAVGPVRA